MSNQDESPVKEAQSTAGVVVVILGLLAGSATTVAALWGQLENWQIALAVVGLLAVCGAVAYYVRGAITRYERAVETQKQLVRDALSVFIAAGTTATSQAIHTPGGFRPDAQGLSEYLRLIAHCKIHAPELVAQLAGMDTPDDDEVGGIFTPRSKGGKGF